MGGLLVKVLVGLALAILEKYLPKGSKALGHMFEIKKELAENAKKAEKRDKIINDPNASLEDKLRANDEFGA